MKPTRADLCGAGRIAAGTALCAGCLALPFFAYAKAAEAWGLAAALGWALALGALYACVDWWLVQRKQNSRTGVAVWKVVFPGALLCGGWVLMVQAALVQTGVMPVAFFFEPALGDPDFWFFTFDKLLLSPLVEEILFRAWLLGAAWHARSRWVRLAISGLVFPFAHLIFEPDQTQDNLVQLWRGLLLLVPSLVFVWVWLRTRSLLACFVTHSVSNAIPTLPWWLE